MTDVNSTGTPLSPSTATKTDGEADPVTRHISRSARIEAIRSADRQRGFKKLMALLDAAPSVELDEGIYSGPEPAQPGDPNPHPIDRFLGEIKDQCKAATGEPKPPNYQQENWWVEWSFVRQIMSSKWRTDARVLFWLAISAANKFPERMRHEWLEKLEALHAVHQQLLDLTSKPIYSPDENIEEKNEVIKILANKQAELQCEAFVDWYVLKASWRGSEPPDLPEIADLPHTANVDAVTETSLASEQPKKRMKVEEANIKAMQIAKRMRKGFVLSSERDQARLIGCSWATWKKTELYAEIQLKYPRSKPQASLSPKSESLTGLDNMIGEGGKDEVLRRLIAEQEADKEPSPIDGDERPLKIHSRNRRL